MTGWIKAHRKITKWEWYDDLPTFRLFIHLLLTVNYEEKKWRGITVLPGQIITGRKTLSEQTGLSEMQVRTSLNKLKSTSEITIKTFNKYSIITMVSWDDYQQDNQQTNQQVTNKQPTNNQQITTTKESKNIINKEGKKVDSKSKLTLAERENIFYCEVEGFISDYPPKMLRAFFDYWSEPNRAKTKMRFEEQKTWDTKRRLRAWADREKSTPGPKYSKDPVSKIAKIQEIRNQIVYGT